MSKFVLTTNRCGNVVGSGRGKVLERRNIESQMRSVLPFGRENNYYEDLHLLPEDKIIVDRLMKIKYLSHRSSVPPFIEEEMRKESGTFELCLQVCDGRNDETSEEFLCISGAELFFHFDVGAYENLLEFSDLDVKKIQEGGYVIATPTPGFLGSERLNQWVYIPFSVHFQRGSIFENSNNLFYELNLWVQICFKEWLER